MNWPSHILQALARGICALSPSCKTATRLQSAALDRRLTPLERFGLRFHLVFCKWCRRYGAQISLLRAVARQHAEEDPTSPQPALSSAARARIKQSLRSGRE